MTPKQNDRHGKDGEEVTTEQALRLLEMYQDDGDYSRLQQLRKDLPPAYRNLITEELNAYDANHNNEHIVRVMDALRHS